MNEPTEVGSTNEALRRRWGIQGGQGPILTMATDAFPCTSVDQETMDQENLYLASSRRCSQVRSIDPAPGQFGVVGLFAPPGGNTLVIVERVILRTVAAGSSGVSVRAQYPGSTALSGTTQGTLHDSRWGTALSTGVMGTASIAAQAGLVLADVQVDANNYLDFLFDCVLGPGGQFSVQAAVDITFQATFVWRERRLGTWEAA